MSRPPLLTRRGIRATDTPWPGTLVAALPRWSLWLLTGRGSGRNLALGGHRLDVVCGQDHGEVRESLWEVADLTSELGVILFRKKPQVITYFEQALEQFLRLGDAA